MLEFKLIVLLLLGILVLTTLTIDQMPVGNFPSNSLQRSPTYAFAQNSNSTSSSNSSSPANVTGTWLDNQGDTIKITENSTGTFSSTFVKDPTCTGPLHPENRTYFIIGSIQNGISMSGSMQRCTGGGTNSTLVKYCGLEDLWETPFNAIARPNNITGQYESQYWSWNTTDSEGNPTNCYEQYTFLANFTLTRVNASAPLPCINQTRFQRLSQGNPAWASKRLGLSTPTVTISQKGCALTSVTMLLSYLSNTTVNPQNLNNWLGNNSGYSNVTIDGVDHGQYALNWEKVAQYARNVLNLSLYFNQSVPARNDTLLNKYLSSNFPVVIGVGGHWVVATCQKVNVSGYGYNYTYNIADPGFVSRTNLNNTTYQNSYKFMRLYSTVKPPSLGSMTATAHSPVYMTITDPLGRMTGPNITQIPYSGYSLDYLVDTSSLNTPPDTPAPDLDLIMPMNGTYTFDVVGTGYGNYTIEFVFFDNVGNSYTEQLTGTASPSSLDVYQINYTDATGSHVQIVETLTTTSAASLTSSSSNTSSSSSQVGGTSPSYLVAAVVVVVAAIAVLATVMIRRKKRTDGQQRE
jgi:hypothetical protein